MQIFSQFARVIGGKSLFNYVNKWLVIRMKPFLSMCYQSRVIDYYTHGISAERPPKKISYICTENIQHIYIYRQIGSMYIVLLSFLQCIMHEYIDTFFIYYIFRCYSVTVHEDFSASAHQFLSLFLSRCKEKRKIQKENENRMKRKKS